MKFFLMVGMTAVRAWWVDRTNFVCTDCPKTEVIVCVQFEYRRQSITLAEMLSHCPAKSENRS